MVTTRQRVSKNTLNQKQTTRKSTKTFENPDRDLRCSWLNTNPNADTIDRRIEAELENIAYFAERAGKEVAKHQFKGASANWERYKEHRRSIIQRVDNLIDLYYRKTK